MVSNAVVSRGMSDADFKWRLECIKRLEFQQKELEAQIETLKDEVKEEMKARGVEELTVGAFKAVWKSQTARVFDSQAFRADHTALYEQYRRPVERRPFSIR